MQRLLCVLFIVIVAAQGSNGQSVEILPVEFNTTHDDFAPTVVNTGRRMFMTTDRSGRRNSIEMTERTPAGWKSSTDEQEGVNEGGQNGCPAMTPDGQYMIFASFDNPIDGVGRTDLYSARRAQGSWTAVVNLGPAVNSASWDSHPTLSSDGHTLYFASDRPGGRGGVDIFVAHLVDGQWSNAVPVDGINTEFDDLAPRIAADNVTLFFASNRPGGIGGYDLYVARRSAEGFRNVRNLGTPINSTANDLFYTVLANSWEAYFSSDRSGRGGLDIFQAVPNPFPANPIVSVAGTVRDAATSAPVGASMVITDLTTGRELAALHSDDQTGEYTVELPAGHIYSITATRSGYLFFSDRYDVPASTLGENLVRDIELTPIDRGAGRLLVFFDFDSDHMTDESRPELERLVQLMREQPRLRILLEGHTDDVGSDTYNDDLSLRRARAVRTYVLDAGIDGERMKTTGLGKRAPLIPAQTDEARARNRRVEMRVLP